MKKIVFAAALCVSSIAFAQNTGTQPAQDQTATEDTAADQATTAQPSGQTVDDPSQAAGPQGVTQQGTDPNGQAAAPAGTNQMPSTAPMPSAQAAFTPRPATTEYPPCSRTVTDACIQTYERGVRRARRGR